MTKARTYLDGNFRVTFAIPSPSPERAGCLTIAAALVPVSRKGFALQDLSKEAQQAGLAVDIARRLESRLAAMGATGKGLHEKADSLESRLPKALVTKLHFIASVRNKIVHEDELLSEEDIAHFVEAGKQAEAALTAEDKSVGKRPRAGARQRGKRRAAPAAGRQPLPPAGAALRLGGGLLLAGLALVFLLMLLGNDGAALWIGAFVTFFLLSTYFLARLRRAAAEDRPASS